MQTQIGYEVKPDMPGLTGPEVERLYARGADWLAGAVLRDAQPAIEPQPYLVGRASSDTLKAITAWSCWRAQADVPAAGDRRTLR